MLSVTLYVSGSLYEKSVVKDFNSCLLLLIGAGKLFSGSQKFAMWRLSRGKLALH